MLSACDASPAGPPGPPLSEVQVQVFNTSCAVGGCHAGPRPARGMDLSEGRAYASIVGVRSQQVGGLRLVDPGNPDGSYLVRKVRGDAGIEGEQMPLFYAQLTPAQIYLLERWIAGGAPAE